MTEQTRDDEVEELDGDVEEEEYLRAETEAAQKRADIAKRAAGGDSAVAVAALEQQQQFWLDVQEVIKHVPQVSRNRVLGVCKRIENELWHACAILAPDE